MFFDWNGNGSKDDLFDSHITSEHRYFTINIREFVKELRQKLPSEDMFVNAFKNVGWSHHYSIYSVEKNKTRVQTVLEVFERYNNNGICTEDFTIEHLLPDNEDNANGQIGNLIPLEEPLNKRCKAKALEEKIDVYSNSSYKTARMFGERFKNKDFNPAIRTEYMAKQFYEQILEL